MVRLGGKSSARTKALGLREQPSHFRLNRDNWSMINKLKIEAARLADRLSNVFDNYLTATVRDQDLMEHLEFDDPDFYDTFAIPGPKDGEILVGRKGKAVNRFYLLNRWKLGIGPGIFENAVNKGSRRIWEMSRQARNAALERWKGEILKEKTSQVCNVAEEYNKCISRIDRIFNQKDTNVLSSKRIIACTTTGAAKYVKEIQSASPGVLLVEEAGEILESHILAALGSETKQLILIGDHKQLRPKYANYSLSVEKGEGFDFNRSLFERLVLKGFPHQILTAQHRMRPEISSLVRQLTYPELADAPSTKSRPNLRGFQGNVIFVNHDHPEDDNAQLNQNDPRGSSKQNIFEAKMILNCVRYLSQNGYGSEEIVVLTPYLAQLHLLRNTLKKENDPILNDLDSHELTRAGLMPVAAAQLSKRPLRISSIGEKSIFVVQGFAYDTNSKRRALLILVSQ
jgi:AAA domain